MKRLKINKVVVLLTLVYVSFFCVSKIKAATYISESQKEIIRDTKRLNDLTILKEAIENYKKTNGYYPKIESESNITGYVNSAWGAQWTSFCKTIGLSSCPVDPVNKIVGCDCNFFNNDCNYDEFLNKDTCYNTKIESFICTQGSNIYQYQSLNNGKNYSLMMEFEYKKDDLSLVGADYWGVNKNYDGNFISVYGNCSNVAISAVPGFCGDGIVQTGEECDGNDKIQFCTNKQNEIGKIIIKCNNNCKFETKETKQTDECMTTSFCGDGVIDENEECDGGSERMCFYSDLGQHDWYSEKIRYCTDNCKWNYNNSYKSSLTSQICGGYCGDGELQVKNEDCDFGDEYLFWDQSVNAYKTCGDYLTEEYCPDNCYWNKNTNTCYKKSGKSLEENHCYIRNGIGCKYINNSPKMPDIKNKNFVVNSYVKQDTYYSNVSSSINEDTLFINKIAKNSVYVELSLDGVAVNEDHISDIDGDEIMYKFDFVDADNKNIGFFIGDNSKSGADSVLVTSRGNEVTGKWLKHTDIARKDGDGNWTSNIFIRIYSTETSLKEKKEEVRLIDGGYAGDYKIRISIKDSWEKGDNVAGNKHGEISSKELSFHIGTSCGDYELQSVNDEGNFEFCEWKPGYSKFFNWSTNEPSGNGYCATLKIGNGWNGKWDDENCDVSYRGICEKKISKSKSCEQGWLTKEEDEENTCYIMTSVKKYDLASIDCQDYGAYLINIDSSSENAWINSKIETKEFKKDIDGNNITENKISGVWIGYYNIKKIRGDDEEILKSRIDENGFEVIVSEQSLWVPSFENGNPDVYASAVFDGGSGKKYSSQYLCSNVCTDIGGYCGDGILQDGSQGYRDSERIKDYYTVQDGINNTRYYTFYLGNFEECDPTAQGKGSNYSGQTGLGTGYYKNEDGVKKGDSYGCSNCKLNAGYCGDGSIQRGEGYLVDYERCDYRYAPTTEDTNLIKNNEFLNYICTSTNPVQSGNNLNIATYKILNPKSEGFSPWIAYIDEEKKDPMSLYVYIQNPDNARSFKLNENGACVNISRDKGGYCGDGKIQMSYITYLLNENVGDEDVSYVNSAKKYFTTDNDSRLEFGKIKQGERIEDDRIIIGTSNYNESKRSNSSIVSNWGINSNNNKTSIEDEYWIEQCDPEYYPLPGETNNLTDGVYVSVVDQNLNFISSVKFDGKSLLRYNCSNRCKFTTYKIKGTSVNDISSSGIELDTDDRNDNGNNFCGDGIITKYGEEKKEEECDPNNYIVGPNGSDANFGDNASNYYGCRENTYSNYIANSFVYGKDCSTFITPATSDVDRQYSCTFDCKDAAGYCGDGNLQAGFFEECDYAENNSGEYNQNSGLIINTKFASTTNTKNYFCGTKNGYDGYTFDDEFITDSVSEFFEGNVFSSNNKSKDGKSAACKNFGGFCGDGKVQACKSGDNFYGGNENYDKCLVRNTSDNDGNIINGEFVFNISSTDNIMIESCDTLRLGCFEMNGNVVKKPVLNAIVIEEGYDFTSGKTKQTVTYEEDSFFNFDSSASKNVLTSSGVKNSSDIGITGVCGSANGKNGIKNSEELTKNSSLCSVGIASNISFDGNTKKFVWSCNALGGGLSAECSATGEYNSNSVNGVCGKDSYNVCNNPSCTYDGKIVSNGEYCNGGNDCKCKDGKNSCSNTEKTCVLSCSLNGEDVNPGEACNTGGNCNGGQQKFSTEKALKYLCDSGYPSIVTMGTDGMWHWTCYGTTGKNGSKGADKTCTARISIGIDGKCGANNFNCDVGTVSSIKYDKKKEKWVWKCVGYDNGNIDECEGNVSGWRFDGESCGSKNNKTVNGLNDLKYERVSNMERYSVTNLCSSGIPTEPTMNGNKLVWKCGNKNCSANISNGTVPNNENGKCDTNKDNPSCSQGVVTGVYYVSNLDELKWSCQSKYSLGESENCRIKKVANGKVDGKCDFSIAMFKGSSGVQNPGESEELDNASMFFKLLIGSTQLCKSGIPVLKEKVMSNTMNVGKKQRNTGCVTNSGNYYTASSLSKVSYDCFKLVIHIPFAGDVNILTMSFPWQWSCTGINGGKTDDCMMFNPNMFGKKDGVCGKSNGQVVTSLAEIRNKCSVGYNNESVSIGSYNISTGGYNVSWVCYGVNEGSSKNCSAVLKVPAAIQGECGNATGLSSALSYDALKNKCKTGIAKDLSLVTFKDTDGKDKIKWTWKCASTPGLSTQECSTGVLKDQSGNVLSSLYGKCKENLSGSFNSSDDIINAAVCEYGYITNITYSSSKKEFKWNCVGSGKTANCSYKNSN